MTDFASPSIIDSRRLMGPNLYGTAPGAVLEVRHDDLGKEEAIARWTRFVSELRVALAWTESEMEAREHRGGATLFSAAPVGCLMTATEVNELAWVTAERKGACIDDGAVDVLRKRALFETSATRNLGEIYRAAREHNVSSTFDDEELIIGSGSGAIVLRINELPDADSIEWKSIHDVPIALVAGSNGKTTTTRLVGAMLKQAEFTVGWNCSDGVWIGAEQIEAGDFAGPAGARLVLRDKRVEAAVLETARGGMLRRGLAVTRADVAIITNISADHFGEYGMQSLEDLTGAKAIVGRVVSHDGLLVLNADDLQLRALGARHTGKVAWFSTDQRGDSSATLIDGHAVLRLDGTSHSIGAVENMPITLGGSATHNIMNVLGASLVASTLGVSIDAIRETLASFGLSPTDNPGRLQVFEVGGVTALVDYAHNPEGLASLCATAMRFPARRRAVVLGQAGNREDDQIRALVRIAVNAMSFDRIFVKDVPELLRGRAIGEVPAVILNELDRLGYPRGQVEVADTEIDGVRRAFEWARAGDVLVCPVHIQKTEVQTLLDGLQRLGLQPDGPRA